MLYFYFDLVQISFSPIGISFLIQGLFLNELLNFQIFEDFLVIIFLFILLLV